MKPSLLLLIISSLTGLNQVNSSSIPRLGFQSSLSYNPLEDDTCSKAPASCSSTYNPPLDSKESCCYNGAIDNSGKQAGLVLATQFW